MKKLFIKPKQLKSQPTDKAQIIFAVKTLLNGTQLDLFIETNDEFVSQRVGSLELVEEDIIELKLTKEFELEQLTEAPKVGAPVMSIWLRCSCKNKRELFTVHPDMNCFKCGFCGKEMNIINWTGRVGDDNTYSIIELTNRYAEKWLKSNGWLRIRDNLWAIKDKNHNHYVDFRKTDFKPKLYAYALGANQAETKPTHKLKKVSRELIPYFERPTAKELSIMKSHSGRILNVKNIPVPFEVKVGHEGHDDSIPWADKCPGCGENSYVTIKNSEGTAKNCHLCNHREFVKEEHVDKKENGKGPENIDTNFF